MTITNGEYTVCGMFRSGTTLMYNVLHYLKNNCNANIEIIHKKHVTQQSDCNLIYSHRDIRDVMASMCQLCRSYPQDFDSHQKNFKDFIDFLIEIDGNNCQHNALILNLKYEVYIYNFDFLLKELNKKIKFDLTDELINKIEKEFNIKKTYDYTKRLLEADPITQYWASHIHDGIIEKWKSLRLSIKMTNLVWQDYLQQKM